MASHRVIVDREVMNTTMNPRVVCGLDDTSHAPVVIEVAATIARRLDLPLHVVHSPGSHVYTAEERSTDIVEAGWRTIARLIEDYDVAHVTIQPGPAADLLRSSLADGATLGVVGSRGRGPVRAALLGSVSADLVRAAPCPVVIVAPGAAVPDLDDGSPVVCRLDGSVEDMSTLRAAAWFTLGFGARLLAINIRGEDLDELRGQSVFRVQSELATLPAVDRAIRVETRDPIDQIHNIADSYGAAMIVVGSHGDSLLPSPLAGAVSARLVAEARRPVMIVSPAARIPFGVGVQTADAI
jgi:nucleotide-binding universal stress UspA family protein